MLFVAISVTSPLDMCTRDGPYGTLDIDHQHFKLRWRQPESPRVADRLLSIGEDDHGVLAVQEVVEPRVNAARIISERLPKSHSSTSRVVETDFSDQFGEASRRLFGDLRMVALAD
jgi:hypothetical protein